MKRLALLIAGIALLAATVACSPSRSHTKKGNKLAQAGIYDEASYAYMLALANDRSYIDARIGLRNTAQKALNSYLDRFYRAHGEARNGAAVYAYQQADRFYKDVVAYNVELDFPPYYKDYYEEDLAKYLAELYEKGNTALEAKRFKEAETHFKEISQLDANYKDVNSRKQLSIIIPLYEAGLVFYQAGNYREAYGQFDQVYKLDPQYKEVNHLRRTAKERATLTVAVLPFEQSLAYAYPIPINSYIISDLANASNEFIVVIDRENTEKLVKEQKISLANSNNDNLAVIAGELMGAKAILTGKIIDFGVQQPQMKHYERTGYESYQERVMNASTKKMENKTRYRKVMYSEFVGESAVRMKLQYQLISTESGTVLVSDVMELTEQDVVRYVSYDGNPNNLFAGNWKSLNNAHPTDKVYTSYSYRREMENLLKGKRDFVPTTDLLVKMQQRISNQVVNQVLGYEISRNQ
jgi:tetratricopeptide (TPR) repeat protein